MEEEIKLLCSCREPCERHGDQNETVGHLQRFGDRSFEALLDAGLEDDAIDDGFNGVVLALLELNGVGEIAHLAVDAGAKALLIEFVE